jgi:type II secretory pathway pseudopilin PulG
MRKALQRQTGLTLLELVVSLLVLTILTTVAIRSVSGIQEQARYETTRKLLREFRRAILGDGDWSSGVFGYAFDLATFPDNLRQLLQSTTLWNPSLAAVSYYYDNSTKPQTQELGYGWRGPYLAVNASADDPSALRDGFGGMEGTFSNTTTNTTNYGWSYTFDPTSLTIRSSGADRKLDLSKDCGPNHEEDCEILKREEYQFTPRTVTVSLTPLNNTSNNISNSLRVFLAIFARSASGTNHLAAAFSSSTVVENGQYTSLPFTFSSSIPPLTAGPVLIGLFRCNSACPPKDFEAFSKSSRSSRRVYPDGHRLLYWQVRPKSNSFMIYW